MEQLIIEQDSGTNPLIPGGKAAKIEAINLLNTDDSHEGNERRLMSPAYNPLIPGSPRYVELMTGER
jgi:hypothetical protein